MPLDFSSMISSAQKGDVLKPIVHRVLYNPTFKGFDVPVRAWTARPYDGKFHPSSHSLLTVRQLYLYLTRPQLLSNEVMELTGVLAVTSGNFWHEFLQRLWIEDGTMIRAEVPVRDDETNRVGHADGELTNGDIVEIKSINEFQIHKIDNEMILKQKKPEYWGQTQDYLDCLGRDIMRYFIIHPAWPFPMMEFTVKADKKYQAQRRGEYMRAIEMAQQMPDGTYADDKNSLVLPTCCSPGSKTAQSCFARLACPVGRFVK